MSEQQNNFEKVKLQTDVGFDIRFVTMQQNSPHHSGTSSSFPRGAAEPYPQHPELFT